MKKTTRNLLVLSLAVCFLALMVKMTVGALPNKMMAARMTGTTLASTIPTQVGNLETAITDILGIPIDTNIAAAGFTWGAAGLTGIELGHATDTTIARVSAGVVAVEGINIAMQGGSKNESGTYTLDLGPSGSATRNHDVVYQNTSGKKRRVSAIFLGGDTATAGGQVTVDTFTPPTTIRQQNFVRSLSLAGTGHFVSFWFEVQNNSYYEIARLAGSETVYRWSEEDE